MLLGSLTLSAQIHITDRAGLEAIADNDSVNYVLDNDIDLSGADWAPFDFKGTLDGQGFRILNLTITAGDRVGLFGILFGNVTDLGFANVNITAGSQAGAIAGLCGAGVISKCFIESGTITTTGELVGGFSGLTYGLTVQNSYSNATVIGSAHVGGIIGHMNGGLIENCHVDAVIYATNIASGGIVGWPKEADGIVKNCYAKGKVGAANGFAGGIAGVSDDPNFKIDVIDCIAAQDSITVAGAPGGSRIIGNAGGLITTTNNYALETIPGTWTVDANGVDGANMTEADFKDANFFANSLPNWDFGMFGGGVWKMTSIGPLLDWESDPATAIHRLRTTSKAKVYSSNGKVYVKGAEKNSTIRIYNITGVLLQEVKVNSSVETFDTKGLVIIEVVSPEARGTYKVHSL